MKKNHFLPFLCALFMISVLTGCGGTKSIKTDMVTGTVTDVDGSPLVGANINFSPVTSGSGSPAYAITTEGGKYKLQTLLGKADAGTTPGEYIVTITKSEMVPSGQKDKHDEGQTVDVMTPKSLLPESYGETSKSPLRATVVSGNNEFNFTLKADGT